MAPDRKLFIAGLQVTFTRHLAAFTILCILPLGVCCCCCCDHVTDLKVLGGLGPLVSLLSPDQAPELQEGAAYVLGTAASNNDNLVGVLIKDYPHLLEQLLQVGGLPQSWARAWPLIRKLGLSMLHCMVLSKSTSWCLVGTNPKVSTWCSVMRVQLVVLWLPYGLTSCVTAY